MQDAGDKSEQAWYPPRKDPLPPPLLPGRALLSRQVNRKFPFRVVRAKGGKSGPKVTLVKPEERKKCRQRNE